MSRGHGRRQRDILKALDALPPGKLLVRLAGATRPETVAVLRAARKLEAAGLIVFYRERGQDNRVRCYAARPGATYEGRLLAELSVARVPPGSQATLTWGLRGLAKSQGVSVAQARRDLAEAARGERGR